MEELENELKRLIIEALMLDNVTAEQIDSAAPLFGEASSLGLDSIDALELAMALERKFGVKVRADDERNRAIFGSVQSLATYVAAHRPAQAG